MCIEDIAIYVFSGYGVRPGKLNQWQHQHHHNHHPTLFTIIIFREVAMVTIYCERHVCETFFTNIFNLFCFCPPLPPPPPQISLPRHRSHNTDMQAGQTPEEPAWECAACDPPKKDGQDSRGRRHPTTAESRRVLCPADCFEHFPHPAPLQPTSSSRKTHTMLHDNPHPAPQPHTQLQDDPHHAPGWPTPFSMTTPHPAPGWPTPCSMTTHTQLHNPTPSSRMTHTQLQDGPHHAPWQPTPSSRMTHTMLHDDPHPAPGWPTPCSMTTHTQLHDNPHPAPQPHTQLHDNPHPAPQPHTQLHDNPHPAPQPHTQLHDSPHPGPLPLQLRHALDELCTCLCVNPVCTFCK